jgi:D-serine deaminase-like pyridoxal phosphate-dependent protein
MKIQDLDTPALLIDAERMEKNLAEMAGYCRAHNLHLRPHVKTHKIPELARMQLESGAHGITVAKVSEAEVMADAGLDDILVAYPIVSPAKAERVAALARGCLISVALDSRESAECLSAACSAAGVAIGVLVELDAGFHRCGLADLPAVVALASAVAALPGLRFAGLMVFPGQIKMPAAEQEPLLRAIDEQLGETIAALRSQGLNCEVVSGGSTPTASNCHLMPHLTEIRPGTYIFHDRNTVQLGAATLERCALSVLVAVVSTAVEGQLVVDGGSKTFSSDRHVAGNEMGYGEVVGRPDLLMTALTEEHGHVAAPQGLGGVKTGDKLRIVPNHCCTCMHLHENAYLHRGDEVVECYRVAARGKLQ